MKQCPECKRVYADETLNFCLDDGAWLAGAAGSSAVDEPATEILRGGIQTDESPTRHFGTGETAGATDESGVRGSAAPTRSRRNVIFLAVAVLVALAASGLGLYRYVLSSSPTVAEGQINSVAVLPFENASGNADLDYLSDGVSESVIDRLSQLGQLKVISRSSSFRYRGKNLNLKEIAAALGVEAIIAGRVIPRGDGYNIRVELIDAREDKQLWGDSFTRKASDVQALQTDIAREIAENLRLRLSGVQTQQLDDQRTANPQAYELLLKGRFYFNKGGGQQGENFDKAVEYYEQAVAADPGYALAWAELSDTYGIGGGGRDLDPKDRRAKQDAAARKSLELDANLADAHYVMAQSWRDNWQWAEAGREYTRAIELNPNLSKVYSGYANYLHYMKRPDEAVAAIRRALELDPLSIVINVNAIGVYYMARRHDDAIAAAKKAFELEPNNAVGHSRLGTVYEAKGMYQESIAQYREVQRLRRVAAVDRGPYFGRIYAKMGERAKALEILHEIEADGTAVPPREVALLYESLGMRDRAFAQLEKGISERTPSFPGISVDPLFDSLRPDPRFQDLLRQMNLPQ